MSEFFSILKQLGTAFVAFVAYSLGAKDKEVKQELAQKEASLIAANKALGSQKKYEKIKQFAPDSWDNAKRLPDDTKNKVSARFQTK